MKKVLYLLLISVLLLAMVGCGKTKTLHCDNCNTEITVDANSNAEEDWIVYCDACNEEVSADSIIAEE